jgi:hypothetical protein
MASELKLRLSAFGALLVAQLRLLLQQLPNAKDIERLGNDEIEILAPLFVGQQAFKIGGNRDQSWQIAGRHLIPDRGGDAQAVHLGEMEIQKSDVVTLASQRLQGCLAIGRNVDVMTVLIEQQLKNLMGGRAVFRDQDLPPSRGLALWF